LKPHRPLMALPCDRIGAVRDMFGSLAGVKRSHAPPPPKPRTSDAADGAGSRRSLRDSPKWA
jgi:hypothetical protein